MRRPPKCTDCKAPMERGGLCDECKAFNRKLREIVGFLLPSMRTAEDQAAVERNIERYSARAAKGEPLFGEDGK